MRSDIGDVFSQISNGAQRPSNCYGAHPRDSGCFQGKMPKDPRPAERRVLERPHENYRPLRERCDVRASGIVQAPRIAVGPSTTARGRAFRPLPGWPGRRNLSRTDPPRRGGACRSGPPRRRCTAQARRCNLPAPAMQCETPERRPRKADQSDIFQPRISTTFYLTIQGRKIFQKQHLA